MSGLSILLVLAQVAPDATYTLTLMREPKLRVLAELSIGGGDRESSAFSAAPSWGGVEECSKYLHELAFVVDGAPAAADSLSHPTPTAWVVRHAAGATIQARWYFDPLTDSGDARLGNDYRPKLTPSLFLMLGDIGLLLPDALNGTEARKIRFEWKGFVESRWQVACSFGEETAFTVSQPIDAFKHAVFIAGDLRKSVVERNNTRITFALHGEKFGFKDEELVDLGARIIAAERDFFSDWSDPFFLVTLVPDDRKDRHSIGGTALTDSFALFLSNGLALKPGSDDASRIAHLLAHEYFHRWNGGKIRLEEPEQLGYWFSEGFTDFFARRILLRSGIDSPAEYVRRLNESLENYWKSPVRHEKNARIAVDFWKRKDVSDLPYRRGDLVALLLDHEIRATTPVNEVERSLDDYFREALQRGRERGEICSTDNLLELAADYTSQEFADRLRALIVDGADVELESDLGAPFLTLRTHAPAGGSASDPAAIPFFELVSDIDLEAAKKRM